MMNRRGRSLVVFMIVIALAALVLRFAIMQVITFRIAQNEADAEESLKLVTTALENFANDHDHAYPASLEALAAATPPYIKSEYLGPSYTRGYVFNCLRVEPSGYTCTVMPVRCGLTGIKTFTVTTGQVVTAESCNIKE
ncbi:MAG: type II secretion system protein [Candidatus Omnitrophica bacterium]|nr:type II secretion system protein [Candidatus Omnitrophota bacterium]